VIAAGPDGALWFTNPLNNSIGRITTSGTVTNHTGPGISHPSVIAAGPDGALWFTNPLNNSIGRITTSGTTLQATEGTLPYRWKKLTKLPKGLKLKAKTGVLSGVPKVAGTFSVRIQVRDKAKPKRYATKTFTLRII
jgi:hypothetical protein